MKSRSALCCLALLAAFALTSCGPGNRGVESGEAMRILDEPQLANLSDSPLLTAQLPTGVLQFYWTTDADLLNTLTADDGSRVRVAKDAQLVALAWREVSGGGQSGRTGGLTGLAANGTAPHQLTLISGGQRVTFDPSNDRLFSGTSVVAVDDVSDVSIEVTFDGVTQVVGPGPDDRVIPDEAAPLYKDVPVAKDSSGCWAGNVREYCYANAAWLPWVAGEGWASPGQLWPVVHVEGHVPGAAGRVDVIATLDGAKPVVADDFGPDEGADYTRLLVFPEVEPGPTTLRIEASAPGTDTYLGESVLTPSP